MLIEAARRVEAAAKEMLSATNDPSVSCDEARQVPAVCKSAMAALAAAQTSAAAVVAGVERHGDGGVQVLADAAGLSRQDAVGRVKTAKAVGAVPVVRDAVESGQVSQANAKRLAEAIEKTSAEAVESDTELLSKAASMRPEQFTREARRWAADHQGDGGEGDYRRLRERRRVRVWDSEEDGMVHIHGEFDPVAGHRIGNRLRAVAGRLHDLDKAQASNKSERRSFDQCMAEALDSLTADHLADHQNCADNAAAGRGSRNRSSVRSGRGSDDRSTVESGHGLEAERIGERFRPIRARPWPERPVSAANKSGKDTLATRLALTYLRALLDNRPGVGSGHGAGSRSGADTGNSRRDGSGRPIADICVVAHVDSDTGNLVAELPDGTPLPAAVLEELACNARLTGVVFDRNGKPIWRTESKRTATEAQRQILLARDGGCFHCKSHPTLCQIHHIRPVSQGGSTRLDNMVPVCWDCHQKIHHHKWRIRTTNGVHTLHPPGQVHYGPACAPEEPTLYLPGADPPPTASTPAEHSRPAARSRLFALT